MISSKKKQILKKNVKKEIAYYSQIRSRHPSHNCFRKTTSLKFPFKSVIRFGSTTDLPDTLENGGKRYELNSVEAIKNSASKLRMKKCFVKNNVKTADWWTYSSKDNQFFRWAGEGGAIEVAKNLPYPIVAKSYFGSRGNGNYLLNSQEELQEWMKNKNLNNYIFEKFYNYNREYRLHVSKNGCFYTCRKMLKNDVPKEQRWFRNDSNSVWVLETNEAFDKPKNWKEIEKECMKALQATGLDFGACDVRVQSAKTEKGKERTEIDFIIVEINSAPSMGEVTEQRYKEELPKLLKDKYNNVK